MTTLLDRRRTAVATQLDAIENTDAYEVAAEADGVPMNGEVEERRKLLEGWIALCNLTFELVCDLNREWRRRIFRATDTLAPGEERAMRSLFERWQGVCDSAQVRRRLEDFEHHLDPVAPGLKGISDYRGCCRRVSEILEKWTTPIVSQLAAFQEGELSETDLARLEELAQSGGARLKDQPRRIR